MASNSRHQNLPADPRDNYHVKLVKDEIMIQWSDYNTIRTHSTILFAKEFPKLMFARIVHVGPDIIKKDELLPGKMVVVKMGVGRKLAGLSLINRRDYIIIHEKNVIHCGNC